MSSRGKYPGANDRTRMHRAAPSPRTGHPRFSPPAGSRCDLGAEFDTHPGPPENRFRTLRRRNDHTRRRNDHTTRRNDDDKSRNGRISPGDAVRGHPGAWAESDRGRRGPGVPMAAERPVGSDGRQYAVPEAVRRSSQRAYQRRHHHHAVPRIDAHEGQGGRQGDEPGHPQDRWQRQHVLRGVRPLPEALLPALHGAECVRHADAHPAGHRGTRNRR